MAFPKVPDNNRNRMRELGLESEHLYLSQDLLKWGNRVITINDITITRPAQGIVMTNAAGNVTKRVRLNDAGNGLIFEDV